MGWGVSDAVDACRIFGRENRRLTMGIAEGSGCGFMMCVTIVKSDGQ